MIHKVESRKGMPMIDVEKSPPPVNNERSRTIAFPALWRHKPPHLNAAELKFWSALRRKIMSDILFLPLKLLLIAIDLAVSAVD